MIKLGTENFGLHDFNKVRLGSELVYQKGNFAPYSCNGLYHFDGDLIDSTGLNTATGTYTEVVGRFNKATRCNSGAKYLCTEASIDRLTTGDFYFEFWAQRRNTTAKITFNVMRTDLVEVTFMNVNVETASLVPTNAYANTSTIQIIYTPTNVNYQQWNHVAVQFHSGKIYMFWNGKLCSITDVNTNQTITGIGITWQSTDFNIDELMFCNEAFHLQDFTPPTKPWQLRT